MIIWIIISGGFTLLCTLYAAYDLWKKRHAASSVDVVSSAVELLKPYKEEVSSLRKDLQKANTVIDNLNDKLEKAENRADQLNSQLVDAQTEVGYLKVQVRLLSNQIRDANGDK